MSVISRLESGEGSDRTLDAQLWCLAEGREYRTVNKTIVVYAQADTVDAWPLDTVPFYTESLDAAVALVEKMLPGCQWSVYWDGAEIISQEHGGPVYLGRCSSPARSLCAALLRALSTATRNPEKE